MTSSGRPYMTNSDGLTVGQAIVRARETACIPARAGKHLNISCSTSRPDRGVDVPHHYFERCGRDRPQNGARDSRPGVVYNLRQTLAGIWIVGPCPNTKNTALGALLMQAELCETSRNPDLRARRNSLLLIRDRFFAFRILAPRLRRPRSASLRSVEPAEPSRSIRTTIACALSSFG